MSTLNPTNPRVAIVGAGAIGTYYGAKLARAGHDVRFLLRGDYEHVAWRGLQIRSHDGDFDLPQVQAYQTTEQIGACDLVVIALKSTANDALRELLPPLLHADTALLTLQNGLGNEEFLAQQFGVERVLGGICFVCLNRIAPGVTRHSGHGNITLGEFDKPAGERVAALAEMFRSSGVTCEVSEDLRAALWRKLVWNVPFNGLSIAAGGADVSQILADDGLRAAARDLMGEVIAAAVQLGIEIPNEYADSQIERSCVMGAYRPSSLIDYEENRAVEVEAIWGEPLRQGTAAGASLPRLEMLYRLLGWLCESRHQSTLSGGNRSLSAETKTT